MPSTSSQAFWAQPILEKGLYIQDRQEGNDLEGDDDVEEKGTFTRKIGTVV